MHESILATASRLSDDALLARVKLLADRERFASVELIAHLAEVEVRSLHLREGCPSLFRYCKEILNLSEHAAYNRIAAARAARKFPVILDLLADGSLNLTTVTIIAPHLTPENHRPVLEEATHRSKEEVEVIKARLAPRPDVAATIRKLPSPAEIAPRPVPEGQRAVPKPRAAEGGFQDGQPAAQPPPAPRRPMIEPLAPSATGCNSRWGRRPTTGCDGCRSCSPARSPMATQA